MKRALFLTAYNRVAYLQQTLHSWETVRGLKDWHLVVMIEPSVVQDQIQEEVLYFCERLGLTDYQIYVNPERYGVLHHPWVGFERLLGPGVYDFVVRAEDDLVVSDDILEFFEWASEEYRDDPSVATVQAYSEGSGGASEVELLPAFSPWVWGTWRNVWRNLIGPTWDHDYSTFNGSPGHQSGWDWNLNTRIFPNKNLRSVTPRLSRSNNIGVHGIHGTAENFVQALEFHSHVEPQQYQQKDDSTKYD